MRRLSHSRWQRGPACLGLGVLSTVWARKLRVEVNERYQEPVNLYLAPTLEAGERKSATVAAAAAPVREYEAELEKERRPAIAQALGERRILEKTVEYAEAKASRASTPEQRDEWTATAIRGRQDLAELPPAYSPRLLCDDVTPEALASMLAEQGGRMSVLVRARTSLTL